MGAEREDEAGAPAQLAFGVDRAVHLVREQLADAESEACALRVVLLVLAQGPEVDEELAEVLLRNAWAVVLDSERDDQRHLLAVGVEHVGVGLFFFFVAFLLFDGDEDLNVALERRELYA